MSMEFFAWPWMELFFKEDADKYRFNHLADSLEFIPYGVAVDEFQHFVYEQPGGIRRRSASRPGATSNEDICRTVITTAMLIWNKGASGISRLISSVRRSITSTIRWPRSAPSSSGNARTRTSNPHGPDYLQLCQAGGSRPSRSLWSLPD